LIDSSQIHFELTETREFNTWVTHTQVTRDSPQIHFDLTNTHEFNTWVTQDSSQNLFPPYILT